MNFSSVECPKSNMPRSDSGVGEHVTVDISEGERYVETEAMVAVLSGSGILLRWKGTSI